MSNTPSPSSSDNSQYIVYSILGVMGALLVLVAVYVFFQDGKIITEPIVQIRQKTVEMIAEGVKLLYDREPASDMKAYLLIHSSLEELNNISKLISKNEETCYLSCCSQDDIFDAKLEDEIKGKPILEKLDIVLKRFDNDRKDYIKNVVCESIRTALNFRSETAGTQASLVNNVQVHALIPNATAE